MKIAAVRSASPNDIKATINALDKNKSLKVNGLYASDLEALKTDAPELYYRVADFIKNDRWCPFVGSYSHTMEMSSAALIKSCLYSTQYFRTNFGKKYRVFHGAEIYNNSLPQIVYSSLFDASVIDSETQTRWICSDDGHRTLSLYAPTVSVDDCCADDEYITYEEYVQSLFASELNLNSLMLTAHYDETNNIEKELLNAEAYSVLTGQDHTADIKTAWLKYLSGDKKCAAEISERITNGNTADIMSVFRLSGDGIVISELKNTEDGTGDVLLRVRETAGKEKGAYIICGRLNAGFRFEIMPYEIQTFRIKNDGSGSVTEIYICE